MGIETGHRSHRFCVAPMMACTDRHARFLLRLLSKHARLYSEMVPMNGLLNGDPERFLAFSTAEHPVALQIGGSDPDGLARSAKMAAEWGYDEVNLNVGCPSDRVSKGRFGACLMAEPSLVAECIQAMSQAVRVPVTVKCRIGIDDMDTEQSLDSFVDRVSQAGCQTLIVHARKALLNGLSPAENRTVPPLKYDRVYRLKQDFPSLNIVLNGGISSITKAEHHLKHVDGVMLGRAAYDTPYLLSSVDSRLFADQGDGPSRQTVVERYIGYCRGEVTKGVPLHHLTQHLLGLFKGVPGARLFRRHLSTYAPRRNADVDVIREAVELVQSVQVAA